MNEKTDFNDDELILLLKTVKAVKAVSEWSRPFDYPIAISEATKILKAGKKENERANKV